MTVLNGRGWAAQQERESSVGGNAGGSLGSCPVRSNPPQALLQTEEVAPTVRSHFEFLLGLIRWGGVGRRKEWGDDHSRLRKLGKCYLRAYLGI